jgi:tRNA/rRNA methyltransferase
MSLRNCRVVLVRPRIAANLGAVARILRNMGLERLVLVAPEADPGDREARRLSTRGESILNQATIVPDLSAALADSLLVAGTSARIGGPYRRQSVGLPAELLPRIADVLPSGPAALVFGPESSGLTDEEVARCHHLIHIPADPGYPALNLAQAVAVCLYELRRAWLRRGQLSASAAPAPFADQERMFGNLQTALEEIHFLYGDKAGPLMHALRHLIGRAGPTPMEVDVLFGLARQIRWFVASRGRPPGG